jgi:hypothetical protein
MIGNGPVREVSRQRSPETCFQGLTDHETCPKTLPHITMPFREPREDLMLLGYRTRSTHAPLA